MDIIDMRVRIPRVRRASSPESFMVYYQDKAGFDLRYDVTVEQLLEEMERGSVDRAVVHSEWEFEDPGPLNESVAKLVGGYPDKFAGVVSVDPREGVSASVARVKQAFADTPRCVGLSLQPAFVDMLPGDPRLYPLYQLCVEYGVPVWLHTGINYAPNHSMEADRPMNLEKILLHFPDIVLVACHSGWPWVGELCALARKFHPRVYLEIGGIAPRYIFAHDTGWDPFLRYADSLLQDQVLFGTDWPIISFERAVAEIEEAPIKDRTKSKILGENGKGLIDTVLEKKPT